MLPLLVPTSLFLTLLLSLPRQRAQSTTTFTSTTTTTTPTTSTATPKTPLLQVNFPDPCIILDPESGIWYAFATGAWPPPPPPPTNASSNTTTTTTSHSSSSSSPPPTTNYTYKNIQAASAPSPSGPWIYLPHADPLPLPGGWTSGPGPISQIWAPSVVQLNASSFVLYYTALLAGNHSRFHCVGAATAASVLGPYDPLPQPVVCPLDKGGAIDPAGFLDPESGRRYLVYKVDGNALGEGGECNNGVEPVKGTPIVLQEVEAGDGVTLKGDGVEVLDRDEKGGDGPLVEAPDVVWVGEGRYVLFYSNHCWDGPGYSVNYAVAEGNVSGPYERSEGGRLIGTGDGFNVTAPGGAASVPGGGWMVFHGNCPQGRCMFGAAVEVEGEKVAVS